MNGDELTTTNLLGLTLCLGGICSHVIHKFATAKPTGKPVTDDIDCTGDGTGRNNSIISNHSYNSSNANNNKQQIKLDYFSGQNLPLLDSMDDGAQSDSDNSQMGDRTSDVIFDVLKRRDARR